MRPVIGILRFGVFQEDLLIISAKIYLLSHSGID